MKTLFLSISLFCFSLILLAQEETYPLDSIKYEYCEIWVMPKTLNMQIEAAIVFSLDSPFWKDALYSDVISDGGKFRTYKYALDILNIMAKRGWRYKDHYMSNQGGNLLERYLLEKPR